MPPSFANERDTAEATRERLITLLRGGPRAVDELAAEVALTPNAVRFHLAGLERDGAVQRVGVRKGAGPGKPAAIYAVTVEAEIALSRAYAPVLAACLEELGAVMSGDELVALLHRAGERLAREVPAADGSITNRVKAAAALLNELGGMTTVRRSGDELVISGHGCPLAAAIAHEPRVCGLVEALLSRVVGADLRERCDRSGPRPSCRFVVARSA